MLLFLHVRIFKCSNPALQIVDSLLIQHIHRSVQSEQLSIDTEKYASNDRNGQHEDRHDNTEDVEDEFRLDVLSTLQLVVCRAYTSASYGVTEAYPTNTHTRHTNDVMRQKLYQRKNVSDLNTTFQHASDDPDRS